MKLITKVAMLTIIAALSVTALTVTSQTASAQTSSVHGSYGFVKESQLADPIGSACWALLPRVTAEDTSYLKENSYYYPSGLGVKTYYSPDGFSLVELTADIADIYNVQRCMATYSR